MILKEDIISPKTGEVIDTSDEAVGAAEPDMFGNHEYITGTAAMNMLRFSRHTFEKCVGGGMIPQVIVANKTVYDKADIDRFMFTAQYETIFNGSVDERNSLNDLTGKEWVPETKSYFFQKGLGKDHPAAQIERLHPAYSMLKSKHFL